MANEGLLKGVIIGGLIGLVLGVLYAPKSGKETREEIEKTAGKIMDKGKEQFEQACIRMDGMISRVGKLCNQGENQS